METAPKFLPSGVGAMFAADRGMKANAEKKRIMNTPVNRPEGGFKNFNEFFAQGNEANTKNKINAAATLPEGAASVLSQSPQDMGITAQPGRFVQSPSDMGIMPAMALSPQDMGIKRSVPPSNVPDSETADRAFDLAGRAMNPNDVSSRQSPLDSGPMTLQDVANQERLQAIRNQIALNTGILGNLPEGVDPTQVGDVQGAGQGLQSVFNMQDFVNNNPGSIFPTGYNLGMMNNGIDTGLNFYGGDVAFGNTPEARAALEQLRSINPNQTFTNMLGGTALRRAEGGIASLYGK